MMESSMGYLANNNEKWYEWMLLAPSKRVIRYDTSDQIQMGVQRAHGPINYIEPDVVVLNGQRSWFAAEARGLICMHNISKNKIKFACTAILVYRYSCTPKLTIHALHSAHLDDSRSDKPLTRTLFSILCWKRSGGARPYRKFIKKQGKQILCTKKKGTKHKAPCQKFYTSRCPISKMHPPYR